MSDTLSDNIRLRWLGGGLFFLSALTACDSSQRSDPDLAGEVSAGVEGGSSAGSSAGVAGGAQGGVSVAGTVAGEEGGMPAGYSGGHEELGCGPVVEEPIGREGGSLRVLEGVTRGAEVSFAEGSTVEVLAEGSGVVTRPLDDGETFRWRLSCLQTLSPPEGWELISRPVALYVVADSAREGAVRLTQEARLSIPWTLGEPEGLGMEHLQLFMSPFYTDLTEPELSQEAPLRPVPLVDAQMDEDTGLLSFSVHSPGVYLIAYQPDRLEPRAQRLSYQAILGVSMGGGAAAVLASRHPERFDFVGALGGASDWSYLIDYSKRRLFGGFCELVGEAQCDVERAVDVLEHPSTFERWHYSNNGGNFDRDQYVKIFQDISLIFGNPLSYNPESPYLPVGVPLSELTRGRRDRCAPECRGDQCRPVEGQLRLEGFYDRLYNPEASHPVITFCDGEDGGELGVFDGSVEHDKPVEIALAVDLNDNGRRDTGEPIIKQHSEPFEDVGCDGLPSAQEEGFHPVFNPDPSGDDFHWRLNPRGTERDGLFQGADGAVGLEAGGPQASPIPEEELDRLRRGLQRVSCQAQPGEPWLDVGLDGVPESLQVDEGGYDWGEGDGRFTYNPNYLRTLAHNAAHTLYARMATPSGERGEQLPRFWLDGGIRDLFNFAITGMYLTGRLQGEVGAGGAPVRVFNGFKHISPRPLIFPDASQDDRMRSLGWHVLMRYGDPDASPEAIEAGDGGHVGNEPQVLNRFSAFLWWVSANWPDFGEQDGTIGDLSEVIYDEVDSEGFGGRYTFTVVLPPGYDLPQNAEARYPVTYLLHGYGQRHRDMVQTSSFFSTMMANGGLQKMIFVYPDGSCGARWLRGDGPECSDGLDNDLDGLIDLEDEGCITPDDDEADCREGSFYTRHAAWEDGEAGGRDYEAGFIDMMDYIQRQYRTLRPEERSVSRPD